MESEKPERPVPPSKIPFKLRLTIDPNEAEVIRKGLVWVAMNPDTQAEKDTAWKLLTVLSKRLIGR